MPEPPRRALRSLLGQDGITIVPGVANAFDARLAERAGFPLVATTGAGIANSVLGLPDLGLATMSEVLAVARRVVDAIDIPVIVDIDTGYGNHLNAIRTTQEAERAGAAGVVIEDQVAPKRCGHFDGRLLEPVQTMVEKITAVTHARRDDELVLIARTDAVGVEGLESALNRAQAYVQAGADVIFVESPETVEQLGAIPTAVHAPCMVNMVERGKDAASRRVDARGNGICAGGLREPRPPSRRPSRRGGVRRAAPGRNVPRDRRPDSSMAAPPRRSRAGRMAGARRTNRRRRGRTGWPYGVTERGHPAVPPGKAANPGVSEVTPGAFTSTRHTGGFDSEVDVLVIGAGGAGLTAALAAHEGGATVAIVEKEDRPGGNTALSTGSFPGAGTRFQRAAGIDDSAARLRADLLRQSGPHEAEHLVGVLAESSAALVEWLADDIGIQLVLITDYRHVGHSVPRLHAPPSRRGADLVADLVRAVGDRDIPLAVGNPVVNLISDEDNEVCGAAVRGERVAQTLIGARKVVLAANGFAANPQMVQRYCPDIAGAEYFGAHGSTGEAIAWGEQLGCRLGNMGSYQGFAAVSDPHGALLTWTVIEKGGVVVDPEGRRFADETVGYSGFALEVMRAGGQAYAVFDDRVRDYVAAHESEFRELCAMGGVRAGETTEALAQAFDLPSAELARTLADCAEAALGARRDKFGRVDFGLGALEAPYAACRIKPGLFHTQGGLEVDESARLARADRGIVPNVFAAGGVAAGISGRTGGRGYSSGNGLLTALGLGRIAGSRAAIELNDAAVPTKR